MVNVSMKDLKALLIFGVGIVISMIYLIWLYPPMIKGYGSGVVIGFIAIIPVSVVLLITLLIIYKTGWFTPICEEIDNW